MQEDINAPGTRSEPSGNCRLESVPSEDTISVGAEEAHQMAVNPMPSTLSTEVDPRQQLDILPVPLSVLEEADTVSPNRPTRADPIGPLLATPAKPRPIGPLLARAGKHGQELGQARCVGASRDLVGHRRHRVEEANDTGRLHWVFGKNLFTKSVLGYSNAETALCLYARLRTGW